MKQRVKKVFTTRFGYSSELVVKAPGRINIIGEHTDYNEGFVLPAAIDYANYFAFAKSSGSTTRLFSADYDLLYEVDKDRVVKTDEKWVNLILGVVHHLSDRIGQFDVVFAGNIPQGAGLSSSAALCCGLGFGLSELFQLNIEKWTIAKMAQRSEHEFGGVKCGIMDQFASVFGMTNHVLELNCKTLEHQAHEFDISGYRFLLLDSGVTHELENSAYNVRRQECQSVINKLKKATYDRISYQDLSVEILDTHKQLFTQDEYKRAKHIVTDNSRVGQMVSFLKKRDFESAGECLLDGHNSLKSDFEITCIETDFLVRELMQQDVILGARQVGGGFGGCVLAIAKDLSLDEIVDQIKKKYRKRFHLSLRTIPVRISTGCQILN